MHYVSNLLFLFNFNEFFEKLRLHALCENLLSDKSKVISMLSMMLGMGKNAEITKISTFPKSGPR